MDTVSRGSTTKNTANQTAIARNSQPTSGPICARHAGVTPSRKGAEKHQWPATLTLHSAPADFSREHVVLGESHSGNGEEELAVTICDGCLLLPCPADPRPRLGAIATFCCVLSVLVSSVSIDLVRADVDDYITGILDTTPCFSFLVPQSDKSDAVINSSRTLVVWVLPQPSALEHTDFFTFLKPGTLVYNMTCHGTTLFLLSKLS